MSTNASFWPNDARLAVSFSLMLSPGVIDTPLWRGMPDEKRGAMFGKMVESLPAHRVGKPEDVAQAVLFLAANTFATGTTVTVDGGGSIA